MASHPECRCCECVQERVQERVEGKWYRRLQHEPSSGMILCGLETFTIPPGLQTDWLVAKQGWTWTLCGRRLQPPSGIVRQHYEV